MSDSHFYTEQEVSKRLACSVGLLRKLRANGQGPSFHRIGRLVRYSEESIAAWLKQQSKTKGHPIAVIGARDKYNTKEAVLAILEAGRRRS
jgi:excisionase family DNA binding protein